MTDGTGSIQGFEVPAVSSWPVPTNHTQIATFRFGLFELDPRSGELRREGRLVHLRHQPLQVLLLLLTRAGDLVTREEIKTALWADNVDVDVEQGLNYCIKEIRSALGDSADSPRFVQTLPKRGYRFIADVHREGIATAPDDPRPVEPPATAAAPVPAPAPPASTRPSRRAWLVAAVLLVALLPLGYRVLGPRPASDTPPIKAPSRVRVLVLPFVDGTSGAEAYLADGLTDELISALSQGTRGQIGVLARSTALAFRTRGGTPEAFAREVGATYFVEGTLRRAPGAIEVGVSMTRAADGTAVWSRTYNRDPGSLSTLKGELARAIGDGLRVAVRAEAPSSPVESSLYLDYLRGRFEWNRRTRESLLESLRIFSAMTKAHPEFARGWSGLADSYAVLMDHGYIPSRDAWIQARAAAEKAVALDPDLVEAWACLGMIRGLYEWNTAASEQAFARAAALDPGYPTRLHWHSILLRADERYKEALADLQEARSLDPLSLGIRANLVDVLFDLGRTRAAIEEARSIVSVSPDWAPGKLLLAELLARSGNAIEAEPLYLQAEASGSPAARAQLAWFYARAGRREDALSSLAAVEALARKSYVPPYIVAAAAASLDREKALGLLAAAFEERSPQLRLLRTDPRFDPIRDDPRFQRMLRVLWPGLDPALPRSGRTRG
jgi:DNA-binding winged helix-turn-helix (wHTH) protein/TolB-like protein/Flp pilus assembly protein TadD